MSNLVDRSAALADRRVILAPRNAGRISLKNPDAVVIDIIKQVVWQDGDHWTISSSGTRNCYAGRKKDSLSFRWHVIMITGHGRLITQEHLFQEFWGHDRAGGPIDPARYLSVLRWRSQRLFDWIGLKLETRHGLGFMPVLSQKRPRASLQEAA